jgi:hypothetical protein
VPDPFRVIWNRADAAEPVYTADEVASWPPRVFDRLAVLGLLCESTNAATVVCDACDGSHAEEVVYLESPAGTGLRGYICCPEAGRVSVPLERLRRWTICFDRLAALTALALEAVGGVEEILPSRVWLLGKARLAGRLHEVFLIRGITWEDGPEIVTSVRRLRDSSRPIILVPGSAPASAAGRAGARGAVPLPALVSGDAAEITIDRPLLHEFLRATGTRSEATGEQRAGVSGNDEAPSDRGGATPSGQGEGTQQDKAGDTQPEQPKDYGQEGWLTVSEAAKIASGANTGVITRAVDAGDLRSNGKRGRQRRIDPTDLARWLLARASRTESGESEQQVQRLVDKHCRDR